MRETYLKGLMCYFRGHDSSRLGPWGSWTVRQALDHFFDDRKLKLLLAADCPHWGSPPKRTSFVFDSMWRLSYFLGNYYPEGGSQAFVDDLAHRFEQLGGHILLSSKVDEILVEGTARKAPRASGVRVETLRGPLRGVREISAKTMISNADMNFTYGQLLKGRWLDPEVQERISQLRPSFPCFLSHLGLRDVDHGVLDEAQGYYWNEWDPDLVGRGGLCCKVFVPTLYEPRMAPEGGQVVILQKVLEMDYDGVEDWSRHKSEIEEYTTNHLKNLVPGLAERIVVQTSASARTSWRFTLNETGSMLGWEMSPDQLGEKRPGSRGPIDDLHLVGHWVRPGGGITQVIISAMQVADDVLRGARSAKGTILSLSGLAEDEARRVAQRFSDHAKASGE